MSQVSIPQAVGTVATPAEMGEGELISFRVSIPQAVGTVATIKVVLIHLARSCGVSIPQAVGTVATSCLLHRIRDTMHSFNTASGRHCCNKYIQYVHIMLKIVSIPQAVGTVATSL